MSEPTDDELREIGAAPRASKRTLAIGVLAGVLAGLMLIGAAYVASQRDGGDAPAEPAHR